MVKSKKLRLGKATTRRNASSSSSSSSDMDEETTRKRKVAISTDSGLNLSSPSTIDMEVNRCRLSPSVRNRLLDKKSIRDPFGVDASLPQDLLHWIQGRSIDELDLNEASLLLGGAATLLGKQIRKFKSCTQDFEDFIRSLNETEEPVDSKETEREPKRVSKKRNFQKQLTQSSPQVLGLRDCFIRLIRVDDPGGILDGGSSFNPNIEIKQEPVDPGYDAVLNSQDIRPCVTTQSENENVIPSAVDVSIDRASMAEASPVLGTGLETEILPDSQDSGIGLQSQQTICSEMTTILSQVSCSATANGEETDSSQAFVDSEIHTYHTPGSETNDMQTQDSTLLEVCSQTVENRTGLQSVESSCSLLDQSKAAAPAGADSEGNIDSSQVIQLQAVATLRATPNISTRSLRERNFSPQIPNNIRALCQSSRRSIMPNLTPYYDDQPEVDEQANCPKLRKYLTRSGVRHNLIQELNSAEQENSTEELRADMDKENEIPSRNLLDLNAVSTVGDINLGVNGHHSEDISLASLFITQNESNLEVSIEPSREFASVDDGQVPCCSKSLVPNPFAGTLPAASPSLAVPGAHATPSNDEGNANSSITSVGLTDSNVGLHDEDDDVILIETAPVLSSSDIEIFDHALTQVHCYFNEIVFGTETSSNRKYATKCSIRRSLEKLKNILLTRYEGFSIVNSEARKLDGTEKSFERMRPEERLREMAAEKSKSVIEYLNDLGANTRRSALCTKLKDTIISNSESVLAGEIDRCRKDSKKILEERLLKITSRIVRLFREIPLRYILYAEPKIAARISRIRSIQADWCEIDVEVLEKTMIFALTGSANERRNAIRIIDLFIKLKPANNRELVGYVISLTSLLASKCLSIIVEPRQERTIHSVMDNLNISALQSTRDRFKDAVKLNF